MRFKQKIMIIAMCLVVSLTGCVPAGKNSGLGNPNVTPRSQYAGDLWSSLAFHFSLPSETPANPAVRDQINWYMNNRTYLENIAKAAKPFLYYVDQQVKLRGLPAEIAILPMLESNYNPFAYSKVGAAGLWQMMPGTASGFGVKINWWYDGRRDIVASTDAALNYMQYLGELFHHNWLLALAAYDVGEGAVQKAVEHNKKLGLPTDFWDLPLPQETKYYVPRLLALATIIKRPNIYPIQWPVVPNSPYLARVNIGSQIDLARAAKLADMSPAQISQFNPGFQRWATDPSGPYELLVPLDKAERLQHALNNTPKSERVVWTRYTVKQGDSLVKVAKKFNSNATMLKQANRLKSRAIHPNQTLLIPSQKNKKTNDCWPIDPPSISKLRANLPEPQFAKYTVKHGDTINCIAEKFRVKPRELKFWNGLKTDDDLIIGKELIIWPPRKHEFKQTFKHKVRFGETLDSIAKLYHVTPDDLKKANHITKKKTLHANQALVIPSVHYQTTAQHKTMLKQISAAKTKKNSHGIIRYHVKSGDSLWTLSKKFHVSINDLKRWNKLTHSVQLKTNEILIIYK